MPDRSDVRLVGAFQEAFHGRGRIVLDHGGNVDRHGLPHEDREWSLTKKQKKGSGAPPVKACPACFAMIAAAMMGLSIRLRLRLFWWLFFKQYRLYFFFTTLPLLRSAVYASELFFA